MIFRFNPQQKMTPMATDAQSEIRYSPRYRSVFWRGERFSFTETQGRAFGELLVCWINGTPDVPNDYLLETIDSDAKNLCDLFRQHEAWNTIIVKGSTKGTRRLKGDPPSDLIPFDEMSDEHSQLPER